MTTISLDLSNQPELALVSRLSKEITAAAGNLGIPVFMAGAMARDLILAYGYHINTGRRTEDVDWAMMVKTWDEFEALKAQLLATGPFSAQRQAHRLKYGNSLIVDLIPFGGIADQHGMIAWPPEHDTAMTVLGFDDAYQNSISALLPDTVAIQLVSLPGLALLKLLAWHERHLTSPQKDAHDLTIIARHYIDAGNQDRLYTEYAHWLDEPDFGYEAAGARLLGQDMARIVSDVSRQVLIDILTRESDVHGNLKLVASMPLNPQKALAIVNGVKRGLTEVRRLAEKS